MSARMPQGQIETDGRRLRAVRSRDRIVDAILALVGDGEMNPSAVQIAERAGVGIRSVFRHFEDMDTLYGEMRARMEAELLPQVLAPFAARDLRGRLGELLERRASIFERLLLYRIAGAARRFQSEYLRCAQDKTRAGESEAVRRLLPRSILADPVLAAAIDHAASFETWRSLRVELGLSRKRAAEAVSRMVYALLPSP
jgi:AcrR family transcriptional regulator